MEPDAANESTPAMEEAPKPKNFLSRLGGVYTSPRETFREIGQAPAIWLPLIILLVISLLVGFCLAKNLDLQAMMATQLESAVQQGRATQEQAEQQLAMVTKFAEVQVILMTPIVSLILVFVIAGYAKLFSIFSGSENRFRPILSVTIYVLVAISIIQSGLTVLVLQLKGPGAVDMAHIGSVVASSLGAILTSILGEDALPKFVTGLANAVDVFAIWTIVLLAIGYSTVSKKLKTGTAAFWLVIAYAIIAVISATVSSMIDLSGMS